MADPTTAFGPQGPNYVTVRPPYDPVVSSGIDTWFKNCTQAGAKDGTFATADFFNVLVANLRELVEAGSITLDGTNDLMVTEAVQAIARDIALDLISSGGSGGGGGSGVMPVSDRIIYEGSATTGVPAALVTQIDAPPLQLKDRMKVRFPVTTTNAANTSVDWGFGPLILVDNNTNSFLAGGEMPGGVGYFADIEYAAPYARLLNPFPRASLLANSKQFRFQNATSTSLSNNQQKVVVFSDVDTSGLFTNNGLSGIVVNQPGIYIVGGFITFNIAKSGSGGLDAISASLYKNSLSDPNAVNDNEYAQINSGTGNFLSKVLAPQTLKLVQGDVLLFTAQVSITQFTAAAYQGSVNLNILKII